jgi:microsomal epoxide hydrolase
MAGDSSAAEVTRRNFRTSDGVTLSLLEAGNAHAVAPGVKIAFVPGWSMPASLWQKQLDALGGGYHVLAVDPRGQGESQVPTFGYTAERRARDLQEFLAPLSNVVLVGWSLGAIEALQYVHMFGPGRLAGLILVDSSVGEEPAPPAGGTFVRRLREDRDKMLGEFVRAIFAKPRPEREIEALVQKAKQMPAEPSIALLNYPFERAHWRRIARGFEKPLLYIVTPQFAAQARNLQKNRPGTEIEVFKSAGHALFVDEPERFNALIEKFAQSVSRQRDPQ